ncbi:translocation/assembly module TamB domain-containing protein [Psychromonas sp. 14N.309.X.WAT.B.A12]|uniref:translocation/assembly module TamB domain-containing protein n=1 Tax=Psychromonas sp. 14N.309.X.WAT.B.A12 TaxID=2998322 RepID=UPI0025B26674|nr:translocation/assembly module TamB domain-containing protein [Psychromonas sp. 14N.309.X.WAT.B.A12]MDN2662194.1 translocation/assembly module TamB domain-containing protein [Psychromonas sp. 14N.309.X.WAT.B.A12]
MSILSSSFKIFKYLFFITFVLIVLVIWLLNTHSGNSLIINIAQKVEPRLQVILSEGSLLYSPTYELIRWQDEQTLIELNDVSYQFDWQCIIEEFCIDSLKVGSATVNIPESTDPAVEEEASEPLVVEFPIPVHIRGLDINNTLVSVAGLKIELSKLLLAVDGENSDVTIDTIIDGLTVTLADSEEEPTKANSGTNEPLVIPDTIPAILKEGDLPEIVLPVNLLVKKLDVNRFTLIQNQQNLAKINSLQSQFDYIGSAISVHKFALDIPEANLDLKGNIDISKRYPMDLQAAIEVKEVQQLDPVTLLKGQQVTLTSKGDLSDLATQINLSNLINATIDNQVDLYSPDLPHQLEVQWDKLAWPLTGEPQITTNNGHISSQGNLNNYTIDIAADYAIPDLPEGDLSLKGQGSLSGLTLSQLLVETLQGQVLLAGKLNWKEQITWLGDLNLKGLDFKELSKDYPATLNGHIKQSVKVSLEDPTQWVFDFPIIDLAGEFLERPLTINGAANGSASNGINVNNLNIINGDNRISANGKVAEVNDLALTLDVQDLSKILVDSAGKIQGQVNLAGSFDNIKVNTNLTAKNLSYLKDSVGNLTVQGDATIAELPFANLKVSANNIVASEQKIQSVNVSISPENVSNKAVTHSINVDLESSMANSDLTLAFTQRINDWQAQLKEAVIDSEQGKLILESPFIVTIEQQTVNVTEHCWLASDKAESKNGQLCVNKLSAGEDGDIDISINEFLMASINPFIPDTLTLEGSLDADVNLSWVNNEKPNIDLSVDGNKIALNIQDTEVQQQPINYPVEQLHIEVKADQKNADFSVQAISDGLINANISGQVSPYDSSPSIDAKLNLQVPNFNAFSILIPQVEQLSGHLESDINVTGTLDKPVLEGQILIADTAMKAPSSPVQVSDLNTQIKIEQNKADIAGFFFTNNQKTPKKKSNSFVDTLVAIKDTAIKNTISIPQRIANIQNDDKKEQSNGRVDISGVLDWADEFKADVHLEADQMLIQDYSQIELYISPNIDLIYDKSISVDGVINIDKGKITVKELPEGAVSTSSDVIVVDAEETTDSADLPMKLNVKVSMGDKLRIQALGLDSLIKGDLLVRKELTKELTVNGELTFSEGSYRAFSQELVLQNSRVVFQGLADAPYLNIEAIRDPSDIEDNVTAGVRVTGTPDGIQLTIFSDPSMSQQNALSYITRGYSIESASGDDSTSQLAAILIDLGAGQTDGVMNNIGESVGIKDLSLASSGQGSEQSVGLKGTIAPGVEVSYGVGVFDSFTIFAIRYELFKQFYIEASSGLSQAVDAYYEWDWD